LSHTFKISIALFLFVLLVGTKTMMDRLDAKPTRETVSQTPGHPASENIPQGMVRITPDSPPVDSRNITPEMRQKYLAYKKAETIKWEKKKMAEAIRLKKVIRDEHGRLIPSNTDESERWFKEGKDGQDGIDSVQKAENLLPKKP
jgi:hypothetical protein